MPPLRVCHGEPSHELAQISIASRPEHKVPVIGHDAVPEEANVGLPVNRFAKHPLEGSVVIIGVEERHPADTPVQHMVYVAAAAYSWSSGHAITI